MDNMVHSCAVPVHAVSQLSILLAPSFTFPHGSKGGLFNRPRPWLTGAGGQIGAMHNRNLSPARSRPVELSRNRTKKQRR
jgi:hypothetical protein